jgi:hypothetical protein
MLQDIDKLLTDASKIYKSITDQDPIFNTKLSNKIINTYLDLLQKNEISLDKLQDWISKNSFFGDMIKQKRNQSILYQDSIVIILGWLISNNTILVPKMWPEDMNCLEDLYISMGISTYGIF